MEIKIEPAKVWECIYCGIRIYGFTDKIVYNTIYSHLSQSHISEEDVGGKLDSLYDLIHEMAKS